MSNEIVDFDKKSRVISEVMRRMNQKIPPTPKLKADFEKIPRHEVNTIINVLAYFEQAPTKTTKTWADVAKSAINK